MTSPAPSPTSAPQDLPVLLRAWLLGLVAIMLKLAPRGGYCARVAEHVLRIAEQTICDWVMREAAKRVRWSAKRRVRHGPLCRTQLTLKHRRLTRLIHSRAPRRDWTARITWLLNALDDPHALIARFLRHLHRLVRLVLIASAAPMHAVAHAGAHPRIAAPDD